jgi:hypothetical protein
MIAKRGVAVAVLAGLVVMGGCASPKKSGAGAASGNASPDGVPTAMTIENRIERLNAANDAFAAARKELRGHSDEQTRRELADAFGKLQDVLQIIKGGDADGAFRQQIRIIDRARQQLTGDSATAPEPTVNAAVRAASRRAVDHYVRSSSAMTSRSRSLSARSRIAPTCSTPSAVRSTASKPPARSTTRAPSRNGWAT